MSLSADRYLSRDRKGAVSSPFLPGRSSGTPYNISVGGKVELTAILSFRPFCRRLFLSQRGEHIAQQQTLSRQHVAAIKALIFGEQMEWIWCAADGSFARIAPHANHSTSQEIKSFRQVSQQVHHFDGGQRGVKPLIAGLGASAIDGLLQRIASQNAE